MQVRPSNLNVCLMRAKVIEVWAEKRRPGSRVLARGCMPERRLDHLEVAWPLLKGARQSVSEEGNISEGWTCDAPVVRLKRAQAWFRGDTQIRAAWPQPSKRRLSVYAGETEIS